MIGCNKTGARTVCTNVLYFLDGTWAMLKSDYDEDLKDALMTWLNSQVATWYTQTGAKVRHVP